MVILFILIYLISFAIHLLLEYKEQYIHNVGDLIDNIHFYMWFPILNTLIILVVIIGVTIMKLWKLLKLDILWQKFRNIKLK